MKKPLRVGWRLFLVATLFSCAGLDFVFFIWFLGRAGSIHVRARWLQKWSRRFLWILNGKVTAKGALPKSGILVSNHLSYIDVLTLGSLQPLVLISKSEVRSWPVIGPLTRCAGTLYIRRESRADVGRMTEELEAVVKQGVVVVIFPEGTSSDGSSVLPFRSSLLAPAAEHGWPVTPAWIHYDLPAGSVADEVCYWRDMTFFPHLVNLMSKDGFYGVAEFGPPLTQKMDRKEMARELHAAVCQIKENNLKPSLASAIAR